MSFMCTSLYTSSVRSIVFTTRNLESPSPHMLEPLYRLCPPPSPFSLGTTIQLSVSMSFCLFRLFMRCFMLYVP